MDTSIIAMAERARREPVFFGHRLEQYAQAHGLDDVALAERLGVSLDTLADLRLCGVPRSHADLETLSREFAASLETLRAVYGETTLETPCQRSPKS